MLAAINYPTQRLHVRRGLSASDIGGGVSNSTATSSSSRVSATEHSVCVAWSDTEDEITNVLMRCHEW